MTRGLYLSLVFLLCCVPLRAQWSGSPLKCAAFMLIADDEDRDHANRQKALDLAEQWRKNGYHVISVRCNCLIVSQL